jgi:hypothetical protein
VLPVEWAARFAPVIPRSNEVERLAHLVGEDLAGSRRTDRTRLAVEQFRFERLFDTANALADRCLRAVDLLAGACEMTIFRDLDGSFKVSDRQLHVAEHGRSNRANFGPCPHR